MINAFSAVRATAVAVTAAALVAGCSSTTSGSGSSGGGSGVFGSSPGAGGSAPAGGSGGGTGGGSGGTGNFCHDWKTINSDLTSIASGDVRGKLVAKFDTLAAEAPAAIKNDVAAIDQYIHSLVSGGPQAGKAQQFAQAFEHVGVWMAQNC